MDLLEFFGIVAEVQEGRECVQWSCLGRGKVQKFEKEGVVENMS